MIIALGDREPQALNKHETGCSILIALVPNIPSKTPRFLMAVNVSITLIPSSLCHIDYYIVRVQLDSTVISFELAKPIVFHSIPHLLTDED